MSKKCKPGCACFKCSLNDQKRDVERLQEFILMGSMPTLVENVKPKKAEDFHGLDTFDFAVGEVYGLRVWKVDEYGRLRALHVDWASPWRPGVNEAKCESQAPPVWNNGSIMYTITWATAPSSPRCKQTPSEKCRCGFYAYTYSGHSELSKATQTDHVLGMVKGSGRTLIGTKGFRCEKAEIVALLDPTHLTSLRRQAIRSVYPDVPILSDVDSLLAFAPLSSTLPDVGSDDFWKLP